MVWSMVDKRLLAIKALCLVITYLPTYKCGSKIICFGQSCTLVSCSWHETTNLVFSHFFLNFFFSAWAVDNDNKLFIGPKQVFSWFWTNEKFVFFFKCSNWVSFVEKCGETRLVVWCHEQDIDHQKKIMSNQPFLSDGSNCGPALILNTLPNPFGKKWSQSHLIFPKWQTDSTTNNVINLLVIFWAHNVTLVPFNSNNTIAQSSKMDSELLVPLPLSGSRLLVCLQNSQHAERSIYLAI